MVAAASQVEAEDRGHSPELEKKAAVGGEEEVPAGRWASSAGAFGGRRRLEVVGSSSDG